MEVWVISIRPGARPLASLGLRLGESWVRPRFFYIAFVIALLVNIVANAVWVASAFDGLKDLDSFLHSGAAYTRGLDPYDYYAWLRPEPISPEALNLNPPISVYLFEPLSAMDRGLVGTGFFVGSVAMVGAAVGLLMRAYPEKRTWLVVLIVAGMAGIWHMLWYLQIYAPLLLAMTGAWLLMRRGDWVLAGILIGLMIAVKPNYAVLALVLVAAGHYRPAVTSVVTASLISLVPLLIDGPGIYWQWLHMTIGFEGYEWASNASLISVGERLNIAPLGQIAGASLTLAVLFFVWRRRPGALDAMALGLMTVILVGPVSWAGYTLLLLPFLFSMRWDGWTWASIAILVAPFAPGGAFGALGVDLPALFSGSGQGAFVPVPSVIMAIVSAIAMPLIGAIYAWGVLLLLVRLIQRLSAEQEGSVDVALPRLPRVVMVRPARPPRTPIEGEPLHQQPATIRVRYDA